MPSAVSVQYPVNKSEKVDIKFTFEGFKDVLLQGIKLIANS